MKTCDSSDDYYDNYMKIKFNSDYDLPFKKDMKVITS